MSGPGVDDVKIALQKFGWPDYLVFISMLISCSFIGIYFGFIEKKSKKSVEAAADYLVGGRNMKVFPIVMSLIARYVALTFNDIVRCRRLTQVYPIGRTGFVLILPRTTFDSGRMSNCTGSFLCESTTSGH